MFKKAEKEAKRLKMLLFGPSASGKTVTSLYFPSPVVIDMEKGTDYYGKYFDFDRLQTVDCDEVTEAIESLIQDPKDYKTLVLDPITKWYDALMSKILKRKRVKLNNPYYEIQGPDWKTIHEAVDTLFQKLIALDLNIIVTAHEKNKYARGEYMKVIGVKPDGPDDLDHYFDIVLHLEIAEDGKHIATVCKDRSNQLTETTFEFTYPTLVKYLQNADLERAAVAFLTQKNLEQQSGRRIEVILSDGKKVMTAGITGEQIQQIKNVMGKLQIDNTILKQKLTEDYIISHPYDLKTDEAELLINDLLNLTKNKDEN